MIEAAKAEAEVEIAEAKGLLAAETQIRQSARRRRQLRRPSHGRRRRLRCKQRRRASD